MKCRDVQEQLTGALFEGPVSQTLEDHLKACRPCREFRDAVTVSLEPVKQAPAVFPGEAVWQRISDRLDQKERAAFSPAGLLAALRGFGDALGHLVPKPVIGGVSVLALLLVAVVAVRLPHPSDPARAFLGEQIHYLMDAGDETENEDLGTAVEIFL